MVAGKIIREPASHAERSVWNGLTNEFHPTQMIADMLTLEENFPRNQGQKLVFMGDAENNVANSLMVVCAKLGLHFVACGREERMPNAELVSTCMDLARESGGSVTLTSSVEEACTGADVVYTDIWGFWAESRRGTVGRTYKLLSPYQVNSRVIDLMAPTAFHALPSRFADTETTIGAEIAERFGITEMEVTDEIFRGSRSRVFDEAENRMHSISAISGATLKQLRFLAWADDIMRDCEIPQPSFFRAA